MKDIDAGFKSRLAGSELTTLALCWRVTKRNGDVILGTDHDVDIEIDDGALAGIYVAGANITGADVQSSSDMSVDNTEVVGALSDDIAIPDLTLDDIQGGLLNNAPVTMFFVDWSSPSASTCGYMRSGFLGDLTYDTNNTYKTELRGLTQLMSQNIVQNYSDKCNVVKFGDARCKIDVAAISITATATSVVNRRLFTVSGITTQPPGYFSKGLLVGLTGQNAGFTRQIRIDTTGSVNGELTLYESFPRDVSPGDTFTMSPGCDRLAATCKGFPNPADSLDPGGNLVNFRGYGIFIPGIDAIMSGTAGASAGSTGGA